MTGEQDAGAPSPELTAAERARRHRRLARIFGDGPPSQTRDDLPESGERNSNDEWLRRQVPPHHGG